MTIRTCTMAENNMKRLGSLQFSFLFLNVIFWAVGIGIVGFVSWTLSSLPTGTEFLSVAFVFLYIILFLGVVIAAAGLLGCLGGLFRAICLLRCYTGFMVAFIFIEVAIAIGAYTQRDEIPSLINSTWPQLNNDTKFTLQAGLECCGINSYTEYGLKLIDIPESCFKVYDTLTVHTKAWTLLFETPCLQQIENWFRSNLPIWVTILILICIIQFVSMGLGVSVSAKIEGNMKTHPAPHPPDTEQPPDGATVCSESPHPESSRTSEFSDQQSASSLSGETTTRKLSEVPEEDEEQLSSGVVCCDSKDDFDASRSLTCSPTENDVNAEKVQINSNEAKEEPMTAADYDNEAIDSGSKNAALLVVYSNETHRYENQNSPAMEESKTEDLIASQSNAETTTNVNEGEVHLQQENCQQNDNVQHLHKSTTSLLNAVNESCDEQDFGSQSKPESDSLKNEIGLTSDTQDTNQVEGRGDQSINNDQTRRQEVSTEDGNYSHCVEGDQSASVNVLDMQSKSD